MLVTYEERAGSVETGDPLAGSGKIEQGTKKEFVKAVRSGRLEAREGV